MGYVLSVKTIIHTDDSDRRWLLENFVCVTLVALVRNDSLFIKRRLLFLIRCLLCARRIVRNIIISTGTPWTTTATWSLPDDSASGWYLRQHCLLFGKRHQSGGHPTSFSREGVDLQEPLFQRSNRRALYISPFLWWSRCNFIFWVAAKKHSPLTQFFGRRSSWTTTTYYWHLLGREKGWLWFVMLLIPQEEPRTPTLPVSLPVLVVTSCSTSAQAKCFMFRAKKRDSKWYELVQNPEVAGLHWCRRSSASFIFLYQQPSLSSS